MSCSIFSKIHNKKDVFPGSFKVFLKKIPFYPSLNQPVTKKLNFFSKKGCIFVSENKTKKNNGIQIKIGN